MERHSLSKPKQPLLQQKMQEVLSVPISNHIVCLPDIFTDLSLYNIEARNHWKLHLAFYRKSWYKYINRKRIFHNAFISRCYMMFADKTQCAFYFKLHTTNLGRQRHSAH